MRNRPDGFVFDKKTKIGTFTCDDCNLTKNLDNSIMLQPAKGLNTLTDNKFICEDCFKLKYAENCVN